MKENKWLKVPTMEWRFDVQRKSNRNGFAKWKTVVVKKNYTIKLFDSNQSENEMKKNFNKIFSFV